MTVALEFKKVCVLFAQSRKAERQLGAARAALDAGIGRDEVKKRFGVVAGVVDADLAVQSGQISVLMGLSGSGKSTLIRAANGLNRVTSGEVLLRDGDAMVDVAHCSQRALRRLRRERIAMVFQQFGLLPWRSVAENVGLGLELRGDSRAQRTKVVDEKLELVGLSQWRDHRVADLSGGMQQRVGLARAFATEAEVLLMDEPFSALDPLIRTRLQDELLGLQARVRKTIVFVTHDLDEAMRLGNQISILEGGRIVQTGSPQAIVSQPANDYVAAFVRHMNPLAMLTGATVMRPIEQCERDDAAYWVDDERRTRATTDSDGRLISAANEAGAVRIWDAQTSPSTPPGASIAVVTPELSLQSIVQLLDTTGHPVLVVQEGRLLGRCSAREIVAALGRHRPH